MTTEELYKLIGGDYDDAMARMMKDDRVRKYLMRFPQDDSFSKLKESMESGDMENAFMAAHTLKGVCGNLSLTQLGNLVSELTEDLRNGKNFAHAQTLYPEVENCYNKLVTVLQENNE